MKVFDSHALEIDKCKQELNEFKTLLSSKVDLDERVDVLPFFNSHRHLSSFISSYVPDLINPDLLAFEFDLFGDFACDLAIGDSETHHYLLIEFEDAKQKSLFQPGKYAPEFGSRLEHGYSQLIDWFWKLDDQAKTDDFEHKFGSKKPVFQGMLIIGRSGHLAEREKKRLKWRQDRAVLDSKKISIKTFDELASELESRLAIYSSAANTPASNQASAS